MAAVATPPAIVAAVGEETNGASEEDLDRLRAIGYLDYSDAPQQAPGEGTVSWDRENAFNGYTLVVSAGSCACDIIAMDGEVVHSWSESGCWRWEQARLLAGGDLLVVGTRSMPDEPIHIQMDGRYLLRLSWGGDVVWRRRLNVHHDVQVLPDGRMLTLLFERRLIEAVDPGVEVWDDVLAMLSEDGTVLETVSLYDVVASSELRFPLQVAGRTEKRGEHWIDLFHCNAVEWVERPELVGRHPIYGPDTVLVTSRHQDAVLAVHWPSRELLWYWGPGELSGPHSASLQEDGRLLVFDNGLSRRWSRVVEVEPAQGEIVRVYKTTRKSDFYSRVMGDAQRLANGNVLIANSTGGQLLELTATGAPVWVFMGIRRTEQGHRVKIPRARRLLAVELDEIRGAQSWQ